MKLELCPVTIGDAKVFVAQHHRHHGAPQGGLWAVAIESDGRIIGVAIVGRPVAPERQDGYTAEVTRLCVLEGFKNGCSMLYGACWRAARALGYRRMGTYLGKDEPGTTMRASGWRLVAERPARSWQKSNPSRPRVDKTDPKQRVLWEVTA